MIAIRDFSLRYKGSVDPTFDGLCCEWDNTGVVALVGGSGAGKSTLLACIAGVLYPGLSMLECCRGVISVDGERPAAIRGPQSVSWVPQTPTLVRHMTVQENVTAPHTLTKSVAPPQDLITTVLKELGLDDVRAAYPSELSGGMKTRVAVARALVSAPIRLYLDEPFTGLDLDNRWVIYSLIRRLRSGDGFSTLITSHNMSEAALLANRIVAIRNLRGRVETQILDNAPTLMLGQGRAACLAAGRTRAALIEEKVFPERGAS